MSIARYMLFPFKNNIVHNMDPECLVNLLYFVKRDETVLVKKH